MPRRLAVPSPLLLVLVLVLGNAGCFSEEPGVGSPDATTGGTCPIGSLACPCDGMQCDEGLACEPSISLCIDPTCNPGSVLCTCSDGLCLQGLECIDGLCRTPDDDPDPSISSSESGGGTGSTGAVDATSSMPTTDGSACRSLPCEACRACALEPEGDCYVAFGSCEQTLDCSLLAGCTLACADGDDACVAGCCDMGGGAGIEQYDGSVGNCLDMACTSCSSDLVCARS